MNFYIELVVDKWLREYTLDHCADPYPIWKYCNEEIIAKIPEGVFSVIVEHARFINNTLYWGRMELNKYVFD